MRCRTASQLWAAALALACMWAAGCGSGGEESSTAPVPEEALKLPSRLWPDVPPPPEPRPAGASPSETAPAPTGGATTPPATPPPGTAPTAPAGGTTPAPAAPPAPSGGTAPEVPPAGT